MSNKFVKNEEEVLKFWDKNKIFEKSVAKDAPMGDYVFYDGPPFGTGEPHYGHLLSSICKDVVPRYWTMRGYRVERRWGWDCHGLPIENIIEKEMGISGKKQIGEMGIDKFNEACRTRVLEYADIWDKMIHRIARWVEFKNSYKTMDKDFMESVWWGFKQLWDKDLIYQGRKVLLYCPRCETPISNFEVAMDNSYKEITETSVYVKFKVKKESLTASKNEILRSAQDDAVYVLAWTTTPWTLPANVALAVSDKEEIKYTICLFKNFETKNIEKYIFSNGFILKLGELGYIKTDRKVTDKDVEKYKSQGYSGCYELGPEIKGKDLVGLEYEPLFDVPALRESGKKVYYVAPADFVTTEDGTGVVHTAVVYGEDDYNLGLKLDLPVIPALDEKGHFNDTVPQFKGVYFKAADKMVIEDLEKRGLLFQAAPFKHPYPFCHRCDTRLFYNAIPAWFIDIKKLKKRMLELNEKINWYPEHLKNGRFAQGIEQAPDWNISRNRYFATPIPIWECAKCGEREVIDSVKKLKEKSGEKEINDIHSHFIDKLKWKCSKCGGEMKRIKEVFDCWVESGSMSFAQMHYPFENKEKFEKVFPAQFIVEYISQTRAWFYVMHVLSAAIFNSNSFENVLTTGVILNEKGEKMSKSKKNYPDPYKVINEFGADALRFYLMSSPVMRAENLFFNERDLRDVFRKNIMLLWNVYTFYEMFAEASQSPAGDCDGDEMYADAPQSAKGDCGGEKKFKVNIGSDNILDKWILAKLRELVSGVTENMNKYDMPRSVKLITDFIDDLSTWYLRRSRDRFKGDDLADKQAALATTKYVLTELAKVMAPFMPFIAEQLWQKTTGYNFEDENRSVHLEEWPAAELRIKNQELRISEKIQLDDSLLERGKWCADDQKILEKMTMVRKIVEIGMALRAEANIKVRQALSKLEIKKSVPTLEVDFRIKTERYTLENEYADLIKDELNVKEVVFVDEIFEGLVKTDDGDLHLGLDTELTLELRQEGVSRELARQINSMRKKSGLTINDRVKIYYSTESDFICEVILKLGAEIMKDTLAMEIISESRDGMNEVKIGEEILKLGVEKI
ncbi:MAG: isoleucine--tRNA ligase [bacterium]